MDLGAEVGGGVAVEIGLGDNLRVPLLCPFLHLTNPVITSRSLRRPAHLLVHVGVDPRFVEQLENSCNAWERRY